MTGIIIVNDLTVFMAELVELCHFLFTSIVIFILDFSKEFFTCIYSVEPYLFSLSL